MRVLLRSETLKSQDNHISISGVLMKSSNSYSLKEILKRYLGRTGRLYFLLDFFRKYRFFGYRFYHVQQSFIYTSGVVKHGEVLDDELLVAIAASISDRLLIEPTSQWKVIWETRHSEIIKILLSKNTEKLGHFLLNPLGNDLMYGFDNMAKSLDSRLRIENMFSDEQTCDAFISLAEYLSCVRVSSPEAYVSVFPDKVSVEDIVDKIMYSTGILKSGLPPFPNPLVGERGLKTKHGIASYRVPLAIYQAKKVTDLGKNICEIGAGLGRTGYYSVLMGAEKYTMGDIPISSLCQSHYMLQNFKREDVALGQESSVGKSIKIMGPEEFQKQGEKYDVVLNVDSFTEMGLDAATIYLKQISQCTKYFLSINHENNEFSIIELMENFPEFNKVYRSRCWLRKGYVEELYINTRIS